MRVHFFAVKVYTADVTGITSYVTLVHLAFQLDGVSRQSVACASTATPFLVLVHLAFQLDGVSRQSVACASTATPFLVLVHLAFQLDGVSRQSVACASTATPFLVLVHIIKICVYKIYILLLVFVCIKILNRFCK